MDQTNQTGINAQQNVMQNSAHNQGALHQGASQVSSGTGCIGSLQWGQYQHYYAQPEYPVKIRKLENGYIMVANGKEYVFRSIKELCTTLEKVENKKETK